MATTARNRVDSYTKLLGFACLVLVVLAGLLAWQNRALESRLAEHAPSASMSVAAQ